MTAPLLDEDRLERLERSLPTIVTEPIAVPEPVPAPPADEPTSAIAEPRAGRRSRRDSRLSTRPRRTVDPRLLIGLVVVLVIGVVALLFTRSGGEVASSAPAEVGGDEAAALERDADTDVALDPDGLLAGSWDEEPTAEAPAEPVPAIDEVDGVDASIAVAEPIDPAATIEADEPAVPADEPGADPEVAEPIEEPTVVAEPAEEPVVVEEPAADPEPPDGPVVELTARNEPCKFSNNCLIVGFTITGFDNPPGEFVCEFSSGARYAFVMPASTVNTACKTGAIGDSITVEVDGVRSETIVHS